MNIILAYPPSVNSMYRTFRGRVILSKIGREWMKASVKNTRSQALGWFITGPCAVAIDTWMPDDRRRDLDNLFKPTLDCMTKAGIWKDDCFVHDLHIRRCGIDRNFPRVELHIGALTDR